MLDDRLDQEVVPLARGVALERLVVRHLLDRFLHRLGDDPGDSLDHVADPHADDVGAGMLLLEGAGAARDLREQVSGGELQVMFVDESHARAFL